MDWIDKSCPYTDEENAYIRRAKRTDRAHQLRVAKAQALAAEQRLAAMRLRRSDRRSAWERICARAA